MGEVHELLSPVPLIPLLRSSDSAQKGGFVWQTCLRGREQSMGWERRGQGVSWVDPAVLFGAVLVKSATSTS